MERRALVVGINHYTGETPHGKIAQLKNPVSDALAIAKMLDRHNNGDDNFAVETILVENHSDPLTTAELYYRINNLFEGSYGSVVFFFAGHGVRDELTKKDYLVTTDGTFPNYGVDLEFIVNMANTAYPRIHNITIILDCCHAGAMAEDDIFASGVSIVGKGVTILAGANADESAADGLGEKHGLFSGLLLDGLTGQAGDLFGRVTPASLYNLVDQRLSALQQRPVYKANVSEVSLLRKAKEKISKNKIRQLIGLFDGDANHHPLSPSCEPVKDRGHLEEIYTEKKYPFDEIEHKDYRLLQKGFREGIIEPTIPKAKPKNWEESWPPAKDGSFSMWHAAMYSTGCQLTNYGLHFQTLVKDDNI